MTRREYNYKGFTLVELLIAISLIAILSGVLFSVINPMGIQKKARDSERVSDLSKVKVALENYFADYRRYPVANSAWVLVGESTVVGDLTPNYINVLPVDPKTSGTDCTTVGWRNYFYKTDATGSQYVLATNLEVSSGTTCTISAICSTPCSNGSAIYYTKAE